MSVSLKEKINLLYLLCSPFALKEAQAGMDSTSLCKTYDLGYQREDVRDLTFHWLHAKLELT